THRLDQDLLRLAFRRKLRDIGVLAGRDPSAVLAFAARCRLRGAVHALRDPARELESAGTRVFMDEDAVEEPVCAQRGVDLIPGGAEPRRRRDRHVAAAGCISRQLSSAASADSHTWSSFAVASMT